MTFKYDKLSRIDIQVYTLKEAKEHSIDLDYFKCDKEEFNDYYFNNLVIEDSKNLIKVFLFAHDKKIIGYLTLAMSKISKDFHKDFGSMTTQNVPALLIGGMARHVEYRGRGVGILMRDYAINKAFKLSEQIGCRLLALEAVPDKIDLYTKWGFSPIESEYRNTMFIDLLKIKNEM